MDTPPATSSYASRTRTSLLAGDLVEESATPSYGEDCFPLDWPHALDLTLELIGPATVVVPGHGAPVDREFVWGQRSAIGVVAQTIRDLAGRGVPPGEALGRRSGPTRARPWATPYAVATSSSPATPSGSR